MTRKIWISIRGIQDADVGADEPEPVEVVSAGTYYKKNEKHYILYDTVEEGSALTTSNMVKIGAGFVELTRRGSQALRMVFRQGIHTSTEYPTPCGPMLLGMDTGSVQVSETEEQIEVRMKYVLDAAGERMADCELSMRVTPRTASPE